jgi:hypothetical protein
LASRTNRCWTSPSGSNRLLKVVPMLINTQLEHTGASQSSPLDCIAILDSAAEVDHHKLCHPNRCQGQREWIRPLVGPISLGCRWPHTVEADGTHGGQAELGRCFKALRNLRFAVGPTGGSWTTAVCFRLRHSCVGARELFLA